jgi:hypothetical protein
LLTANSIHEDIFPPKIVQKKQDLTTSINLDLSRQDKYKEELLNKAMELVKRDLT